jgi:hypothetical protein
MKFGFKKMLSTGVVALALAVGALAGAGTAHAQVPGAIFAAAELLPPGGATDPNVPVSGATFASGEPGTVIVTVNLRGQQPNARYVATIRDGACDGAVLYTLTDVQTGARGEGEASTALQAAVGFGTWHVAVSPAGGAAASRLCGVANPAIVSGPAAEPGGAPGMPRTGGPADLLWPAGAVLLAAVACLVVGRRLRTAKREQA